MSQRKKAKDKAQKRLYEKVTQRENLKKLKELNKTTTTNKRGRKVEKKKKLSNMPKEGTRAGILKMGGHGMGADYKSSEKQAFKKAEKWQKSDEKKKITEKNKNKGNNNKLKINKDKKTGGNGGGKTQRERNESKYIRTSKGTLAKRGTVTARRAENKEKARKRAQEAARKRKSY